jgi:hypothetical protein
MQIKYILIFKEKINNIMNYLPYNLKQDLYLYI